MYGVVLWSDQRQNRAVIWCEDHGDLAYYKGDVGGDSAMAAGDLVEFDLHEAADMRLADMPRLITQRSHPTLSSDLRKAGARMGVVPSGSPAPANSDYAANVIPFRETRMAAYA
ncbi:hypothetical protein [Roseovarius arcticus]|uniref:hypothetical protein n=1 Tax=Roseovarius arcticus TaxID=2547404 RepID=UPI0011106BF6|nr:hypothetical protein [Roseovarius arcticus]